MTTLALFFQGFLLGFGAAVPLGPINILIMNEALRDYKKALAIGFGAMSADITYLILIFYGITQFLQNTIFLELLSGFGAAFLIYLSYLIFKGRNSEITKVKASKKNTLIINYSKGYILTLLNPYTILFWLSVTSFATSTDAIAMTLFGMICAILLWITLMPLLIFRTRTLISEKVSYIISIVSSLIIFAFAISLAFKLSLTTFLHY